MAELGTLWFVADIDLSNLKNKIKQGNKEVLDALKIDYDRDSYTRMVNNLKEQLSKESFSIKIDADMASARRAVNDSLKKVPGVGTGELSAINQMTRDIIKQREAVRDTKAEVDRLQEAWQRAAQKYGKSSAEATAALAAFKNAQRDLRAANYELSGMNIEKSKATLMQKMYNEQLRQGAGATSRLNSDSVRLNATLANSVHISTSLGSSLSSLFAVEQARRFLANVIEIGGQLERQRISISAILNDTAKANDLFERIKGLALKSPFGVVELDQYTKQLSAYGFKYNELFDMTKRLADISAGAGTDIGRLTLALGHVRSATYLTGITLRQFSMNNIPMLKMLADYYTELEGKIVSTAEVQKRISKRQVSYQDVIEQIKRLTDEGGMFFNMQEKISESLSAKFKNLKDALDIMYGELAESSIGDILKDMATNLTALTRHWREIGAVMAAVAIMFARSRIAMSYNNLTVQKGTAVTLRKILVDKRAAAAELRRASITRSLTASENAQIASSNRLMAADLKAAYAEGQLTKEELLRVVALKKISAEEARLLVEIEEITGAEIEAAIAANKWKVALKGVGVSLRNTFAGLGPGMWASIGVMAGIELYSAYKSWVDKIDAKTEEMRDLIKSRILDLEKERKSLADSGKPKDQASLKAQVDSMKQVLANSEAYTVTIDGQLKKSGGLSEQYDILAESIDKVIEKQYKALNVQDDVNKMIKASKSEWRDLLGGVYDFMFNDSIGGNFKDVNTSYTDLRRSIDAAWEYRTAMKSVVEEIMNSTDVSSAFREQLKNSPFEEQIRLLSESGYWGKITLAMERVGIQFGNTSTDIRKTTKNIEKALKGVAGAWEEVATDDIPRMMKKFMKDRGWDEEQLRRWANSNVDDVKLMLNGILDQIDEKSPSIRRAFKQMAFDYMRFAGMAGNGAAAGVKALGAALADAGKTLEDDVLADLKEDTPPADSGKEKKDKLLEKWKGRYDALKTYYEQVQKFVKLGYDVRSAMNKVEELGLAPKGIFGKEEATRENYAKLLRDLLSETLGGTEQRDALQRDIKASLGDFERGKVEEQMKKNVSIMKSYVSELESQWKLYREIYKKTGNLELASHAFEDGKIWDDVSRRMLDEFNSKLREYGIVNASFHWDMNEEELKSELRDADGLVHDDVINLALAIQKIIRGNYSNFLKDSASAFSKGLTENEKLLNMLQQRNDLVKEYDAYNKEGQPDIAKGYGAQIAALDKQISSQRWKAFQENNDWGRVFGDLDDMTLATLKKMIDAMNEYRLSAEMDVTETKAWYEAMQKLTDKTTVLDPLGAITDAVSALGSIHISQDAQKEVLEMTKATLDAAEEAYKKDPSAENLDALSAARKDYNEALHQSGVLADREAAAINRLRKSLREVGSMLNELGSSISALGSSVGGKTGDIFGGIGSILGNVGKGFETIASAKSGLTGLAKVMQNVNIVLTVASLAIEANKTLASILPNTEKNYEHYARKAREVNKLREAVDDYRIAVARARAEENGWLGQTEIGSIRSEYEKNGEVMKAYYKELYEAQEAYQAKGATWKKIVLPAATAIGAVVAGAFTFGAGAAAVGAIGASILGSAAVATAVGATIDAAIGYAVGQLIQAGIDQISYKDGQTSARNNLQMQTRHRTMFRSEKTQNLEDWVRENLQTELFDDEGLINLEAAEEILDKYGDKLVGDTKETLERLVELRKEYDEFIKQIKDVVDQQWSALGDVMVDSVWEFLRDGSDALDTFKDKAGDTFRSIAQDAVKQFLKVAVFQGFEDQLTDLYKLYGAGIIDEGILMTGVADIAGGIADAFDKSLPTAERLAQNIADIFGIKGYDIVGEGDSSSEGRNVIHGDFTEQETGLLLSYVNAIRADVSMNRIDATVYYPQYIELLTRGNVLAETQMQLQGQIAANTLRNAEAAEAIQDILHKATLDKAYGFSVK